MKVLSTVSAVLASSLIAQSANAGFVTTSSTAFEKDGEPFYVFGTNAYWASEITWSEANLKTIFSTMAKNDLTVCRLWGFADLTEAGTAPWNIVYQLWENGKPTVNTGDNGLGYFDLVVAAAKAAGVKLVVPFVNNWSDYGGIDVYVKQLGGTYHDDFYTNTKIKAAYKNFVKTFVNRYKDEETIMAWQLCNECRCAGSGGDSGLKESGNCTTTTLTDWITEMSSYIKTLDSNHLVASGSEGFMNTDKSVYLYSGPSGVDFDANLAIDSIDYGSYHAYPDSWGVETAEAKSWGVQWIDDHTASGTKAGKPVVLEEYGVKPLDSAAYVAWSDEVLLKKSHMQYWQFGVKSLDTTDDGYTIYDTDTLFTSAIAKAAAKFAALGGSSTNSTSSATTTTTAPSTASVAGEASTDTEPSVTDSSTTDDSAASTDDGSTAESTEASSDDTTEPSATGSTASTSASTDASSDATPSTASSQSSTPTTTDAPETPTTTSAPSTDNTSDKCSVRRRRA